MLNETFSVIFKHRACVAVCDLLVANDLHLRDFMTLQNLFSQLFEVQVWVVKRNKTKMELESLNERISRIYNTFFTSFQSMTSAEDLLNIANDHPTTRRCVELYIKTGKILSKIMAVGFTFLIVPLTYCRDIMCFIFYLFLELIMQWIKINHNNIWKC